MLDDNDLDAVIYPVHGSDPTTIGAFTPDFSKLQSISKPPEYGRKAFLSSLSV